MTTNCIHTSGLERAVMINEKIKRIVTTSAQLRLAAINAMLAAKRAGERSLGFTVVSSEMRVFSRQLDKFMQDVVLRVTALIDNIARILKEARELRTLQKAMDQSERACELIAALVARKDAHIQDAMQAVDHEWKALSQQFERARLLCVTGVALSRSAKIEAAHSGDMALTLKQVAEEIEATVGSMLTILLALTEQDE